MSAETCRRLGLDCSAGIGVADLVVMTGHQPELFHPGVWAKHFAVQRFAEQHGAAAIDLVVDSDRCGTLSLRVPCVRDRVRRREVVLAKGGDACFACVPSPVDEARRRFAAEAVGCVRTLPVSDPGDDLQRFLGCLDAAASRSRTLAETMVVARRLYEAPAGTRYGELFVTEQADTDGFRRFAAHLLLEAWRFAAIFNEEVRAYRTRWRVRSAAHPFPELSQEGGVVETPLWALVDGVRRRVAYEEGASRIHIEGAGSLDAAGDGLAVARAIAESGLKIVPRAVALTMFQRLCVADLFVHGVGGSRYEAIGDRVIERWLGVTPPPYAVVTLTMRLPVRLAGAVEDELSALRHALHVAKHNPDKLLTEAAIEDEREREAVQALVAKKRELVAQAAEVDADKRATGEAIREVNSRLREMLTPFVRQLEEKIARLESERDEHEALSDRECSFPLFDPVEVAQAVR